jgi:uncharacterized membrane protein
MAIGPVQILVLGFDHLDEGAPAIREELRRLREQDAVRLIDMIVVRKHEDGNVERLQHSDLSVEEAQEFGAVVGALIGMGAGGEEAAETGAEAGMAALDSGHVLDESDTWFVDDTIPPGSAAAIALVEHRWAIPLRTALLGAGGFLLADAWVHPSDLVAVGLLLAEEAPSH